MTLHPLVEQVVAEYLRIADATVRGVIEGLYLEGSVALGDFRPRCSDIDFVAVTSTGADKAALRALGEVHGTLLKRHPRPWFDGIYVDWEHLRRPPAQVEPIARSHEGRFKGEKHRPPSPVTWHTLARYGVACRGPARGDLTMTTDSSVLAAWCDANLDEYCGRLVQRATQRGSAWGVAALTGYATVWIVSGVARLHYTLATGEITSKEGACEYALAEFPAQCVRVVRESLRIRRADRARASMSSAVRGLAEHLRIGRSEATRSLYRSPFARRRDVLAFADEVIRAGHRAYASRY